MLTSEESFRYFLEGHGFSEDAFLWSSLLGAHHGKLVCDPRTTARNVGNPGCFHPKGLFFKELFDGNTPYPLQNSSAERISKPGISVIEAPMGMGKTEAAQRDHSWFSSPKPSLFDPEKPFLQVPNLKRKGEQHGFALVSAPAIDSCEPTLFFRKAQPGRHFAFRFRGVLQVTDPERFREAFRRGIGSAKAFGFGMLLLQPLS